MMAGERIYANAEGPQVMYQVTPVPEDNRSLKEKTSDTLTMAIVAASVCPILALGAGLSVRVFVWAAF